MENEYVGPQRLVDVTDSPPTKLKDNSMRLPDNLKVPLSTPGSSSHFEQRRSSHKYDESFLERDVSAPPTRRITRHDTSRASVMCWSGVVLVLKRFLAVLRFLSGSAPNVRQS
jgi:hypothetical protein